MPGGGSERLEQTRQNKLLLFKANLGAKLIQIFFDRLAFFKKLKTVFPDKKPRAFYFFS
jgi:hypothetical protein